MFERLPNKHTSKNALFLITIAVLSFLLVFGFFAYETQASTDITVKSQTSQPKHDYAMSDVEIQIRNIANEEEFEWVDWLVRLANCESKLDPNAVGDSGHSRGLYQIHNLYWKDITDEQAFDIEWSTKWTMDMVNSGYQHYWSCNKLI